ncbi:MAG: hypothetical protein Unbinned200contig1000_40 [Prokaryotic dsDNA virus sp.]|jgi:hypothetical protein|nr:hypothetical protein [Flavobacteriaceae bacterium]QDP65300.1 MAG: hypothetical protein Unbinned200contig1000_40 [Prokaryotic dsDNA virus sp.]|tara:strand:+ start:47943 stop:48827 length:885 start_codon:yes stop_codon:yes gene_type:complete
MLNRVNAFFDYLNERENVRLRKEAGDSFPWTEDPILQTYKFTNVRREHDRTSMKLRELFYTPKYHDDRRSILMNCATFRYFGTWEFANAIGWHDYDNFCFNYIEEVAAERLENRERVFTGAYVITNQGISAPKQEVVVHHFLKALWQATPEIVKLAQTTQSWEQVAKRMMKIQGFGGTGFMTKEILLDTTYTGFWSYKYYDNKSLPKDWNEWTPIGPGALRGAARILGDDEAKPVKNQKAFDLIMEMTKMQEAFFEHDFTLSPTDIQFGLCEFDKYERVRLGQGKPRSKYRVRI